MSNPAADGAHGRSVDEPGPALRFTLDGALRGFRATFIYAVLTLPFGLAVGVASAQAGMSALIAILLSAVVLAGAAQFAALDLWANPLPVAAIVVTTFVVNARHLLYGAALHTWAAGITPWQRNLAATLMTDVTWAMTMTAKAKGERDAGFVIGSGLALWLMWVVGTAVGYYLGAAIGDPRRYGLDVVMPAMFATMLIGLWRGPGDIAPWMAAAAAAVLAYDHLPTGWHVIAGALAGGVVAVARFARR